ncbi:glycosyltransferase family 4 protein [Fusobacterium ulcerans]|uniref:glycosyltransferase family 4 protein n=1 Tax=Fusobacterium ulcerans TaxID=861 RepID=UPI001D0A9B48|nr:glycosyltransferase family 4 protein [Fusobacterium ulcerans]MCB8566025.1 glycosyltransferase family 4 protein [Fusobacterium ulcerans]MCB8650032.1 glycosyltransferase family 4 protein [Fusobacterium ulcerans]
MNILFLYLRHSESKDDSTLTRELSDEFSRNGNNITVVTILEKKFKRETEYKIENGYEVLRVKTGNYFNVGNKIEKGITTLTMIPKLKRGILKYLGDKKYDLIITHTPFLSDASLINPLKRYFKCPAHLILWDIFPQNAKDIGMMKNNIIFNFFKQKEKKMFLAYDQIWCMSNGNIKYLQEKYEYLDKDKIKLLKNWAYIKPKLEITKEEIRKKYGYSEEDFLAIFGGNMGKPQKLENILSLAEKCLELPEVKFIFAGNGSERERLKKIAMDKKLKNIRFIDQLPREDYEKFTSACNIGLVSLDERFTVPNFPSKTTDYFKLSLPILASLDKCSAADYGKFLEKEVRGGIFAEAGNVEDLYEKFLTLYNSKDLRKQLGNNGRGYYEEHLGVDKAYKVIINSIKEN